MTKIRIQTVLWTVIQELEFEIKKLAPNGEQISPSQLAEATLTLNGRIRNQNLSASKFHFSRDLLQNENLPLDDETLQEKHYQKAR